MRALLLSISLLVACRTGDKPALDTGSLGGGGSGATDADGDGYTADEDCDDANPLANPGAAEVCDGTDNNCDGTVDEGATTTFYADSDGDGFGDAAVPTEACEQPGGYVPNGNDCDDTSAASFPGGIEVCDGLDNDCDGDVDDGVGQPWYADADGDGHGDPLAIRTACTQPEGYLDSADDCDDTSAESFPGGTERCDEKDNDCDGTTDEDVTTTYYRDTDGDRYGLADTTTEACDLPTGYAAAPGDCDDTSADISPAAAEVCNTLDDDCDGTIDEDDATDAATWYADADADGYGDAAKTTRACTQPAGYVASDDDCDDTDAEVSPAGTEVCGGGDEDCDGLTDDDDPSLSDAVTWYIDYDGDGYGASSFTTAACSAPSGYVATATDCDDTRAGVYPGAAEICNLLDDDCDGLTDDADGDVDTSDGTVFYADSDGDGFGDADTAAEACAQPSGYVEDDTDCDDTDPDTNPDAVEVCHGTDQDCDGVEPPLCASCLEILDVGSSSGDGLYTIAMSTLGEEEVWCDMTTDGGGWTLAQRTVWDWSDSSLLLTSYATWYSSTLGDADVGQAFRLAGEGWAELNVEEDHLLVHYARDSSSAADCDPLYYIGTGGAYTITSSSTSVVIPTSSVIMMNTTGLSTTSSGSSASCVNSYNAVPWFYTSCCTTCPTFKGSYWSDTAHPMASYLNSTADENGLTTADVCPSGAAISSIGYEGVNIMEYYLR